MKTLKNLFKLFIFLPFFFNLSYSQVDNIPECGTTLETPVVATVPYKPTKSNGSSEQKFKILIVHICFADDNNQPIYDNFWPPHQMPLSPNGNIPLLAPNKITTGNYMDRYPNYTISDYFCEMSMGQLDVVGKSVLVDLPQPYTSEYFRTNGYRRGSLNRFILQNFVDPMVDANFADYDNWKFINNEWVYEPDGIVDMVVMNYRYIPNDPGGNLWFWDFVGEASGEASLGSTFGGPLSVDGKSINFQWGYNGSGCTALGQLLNYSGVTHIIEHEIGHSFFVDNLNTNGSIHTSNGLMVGVNAAAYNMSPYERSRDILGWNINPSDITTTGVYNLRDYVSTGDMLRIQIPGTNNEWFWIANHQKVSKYDGVSRGGQVCYDLNKGRQDPYCYYGKGLFVYHESPGNCGNNFGKPIDIEQADGKWNWEVNRWVQYYNPQYNFCIPLFEHQVNGGNPNTGKGEYMQEIMYISNPPSCWGGARGWGQEVTDNICSPLTNDYFTTLDNVGDGLDGYNIGYTEIFSPYSNPRTNSCQNPTQNSGLTVKLTNQDENGNIAIKIYFNDSEALYELPPAKPMNLKVTENVVNIGTGAFTPKLTWDLNSEPDFVNEGYYRIYRGMSLYCESEPTYSYLATVSPQTGQYIDNSILLYPQYGPVKSQCPLLTYSYKIEAVDLNGLPSLRSERSVIKGFPDQCGGDPDSPNFFTNEIPTNFALLQNYPNPFNPSTEIKFELPQNTFVTLKVYNAVGQVVAELVNNEYRNAGRYSVSFDGTKLASGIYFYSMEAGVYKDVKKMVLIK